MSHESEWRKNEDDEEDEDEEHTGCGVDSALQFLSLSGTKRGGEDMRQGCQNGNSQDNLTLMGI